MPLSRTLNSSRHRTAQQASVARLNEARNGSAPVTGRLAASAAWARVPGRRDSVTRRRSSGTWREPCGVTGSEQQPLAHCALSGEVVHSMCLTSTRAVTRRSASLRQTLAASAQCASGFAEGHLRHMPNGRSDLIDISCLIVGETERAWRVDHGAPDPCWVPKSLCEYDDTDSTLTLPEWLAQEKGMI